MGATAKLMAWLGLDASNFKSNMDGAKSKAKGMQMTLQRMEGLTRAAFSVAAINEFIASYRQLKEYQKETGIKLVSDEDMKNLTATEETLTRVKMQLTAITATATSRFIQAWKAAFAGLGAWTAGGDVGQAMADAIQPEDIEAIAKARKEYETLTAKLAEARATVDELWASERAKLEALKKQFALIDKAREKGAPVVSELEYLNIKKEILTVEQKLVELGKKRDQQDKQKLADARALADAQREVTEAKAKLDAATEREVARKVVAEAEAKLDNARRVVEEAEAKLASAKTKPPPPEAAKPSTPDATKPPPPEAAKPSTPDADEVRKLEQSLADARAKLANAERAVVDVKTKNDIGGPLADANQKVAETTRTRQTAEAKFSEEVDTTIKDESDDVRKTRIEKARAEMYRARLAEKEAVAAVAKAEEDAANDKQKAEEELAEAKARARAAELNDTTKVGQLKEKIAESERKLAGAKKSAEGKTGVERIKADTAIVAAQEGLTRAKNDLDAYYDDAEKRSKEVMRQLTSDRRAILGGEDASVKPLEVGGGPLQSIGASVASKSSVKAAEMSRRDATNQKVERLVQQAVEELRKINNPEDGM